MNRYILIFLISLLLLGSMKLSCAEGEKTSFSLADETGTVYTQENFKGKEVVLFVFTFECPHCRRAMPFIKDIYKQGHQVLGVVYSTRPKELDKKRKKAGLTFPITIGTKEFQKAFNIRGVPTMIVIAPDGTAAERFTGSKGAKRLHESIWEKN